MSLRELQERMTRLLRGEAGVEETAAALGADPERLAIYREQVEETVLDILEKDYPYVARLLAPERWRALAAAYFREWAPEHWEPNRAAERFPAFLEARAAAGEVDPFLVVLAQFEWEELVTYLHPAAEPGESPGDGLARLNPTLQLLELPYDLAGFLAEHAEHLHPGTPLPAPAPEPCILLLYRDPDELDVRHRPATPELLLAFKIAAGGIPLTVAAAETGLPVERIAAIVAAARGVTH